MRDRIVPGQRFMEEPNGVKRGQEDSLAGNVSEYVESIMNTAEREAAALHGAAEEEADRLIARARIEAAACREEAVRGARAAAAERIARILELRRAIERRMVELAPTAADQRLIGERMRELADALAGRADAIARAGFGPGDRPPAAAEAADGGPDADEAPTPTVAATPTVAGDDDEALTPAAAGGEGERGPILVVTQVTPQYDRAHLYALRRAIAGATRADLGSEIAVMLESPETAAAVLDDVFGRSGKPFPKWAAARQASAV